MEETGPFVSGVYEMKPFSVFLPVYNEEEIIVANTERLTAYLDALGAPYEIVIVSNGSTDKTVEIGEGLQKKFDNVRFSHIDGRAPGSALREGISMMRYEHIIAMDMDLSVDLEFIKMANRLLSEDYDLVVGSKRMGNQQRSLIRKAASTAFIISAIILLGQSFDDYSIGAKAYKKNLLMRLASMVHGGTFYVVEVLYYAGRCNNKIVQIPVNCYDNRKSRFNLLHEGIYRFFNLYKLWFTAVLLRKKG